MIETLKKIRNGRGFGINVVIAMNFLFLTLFLMFIIFVGLVPSQNKFGLYQSPTPLFIGALTIVSLLIYIVNARKPSKVLSRLSPYFVFLAFVASFVMMSVVAYALASYGYDWDSEIAFNYAAQFAGNGSLGSDSVEYLIANPNNVGLITILGFLFTFTKSIGIDNFLNVAIALNVVVMSFTQVVTYLVAKMFFGKKIAYFSILFSFVFISMSMYVQIPYTDTLSIIFPITILYIALNIIRAESIWLKSLLCVLLGIVTSVGYFVKPTVLIAFVAVVLVSVVWVISKGKIINKRRTLILLLCCTIASFIGLICGYVGYIKLVDSSHILPYPANRINDNGFPPVHFIAMGMKTITLDKSVNYGGYDSDQVNKIINLPTQQQKIDLSVETIQQQLSMYGPIGYVDFLLNKANWILSDATFYAYGDGSINDVVFTHNDPVSKFLREFMFVDGRYYLLFANILQIFWLCILLLIGMQIIIMIINRSSRSSIYMIIPRLMVIGIILFLLLFEGRARYLFLYLPIFIITALYTLRWFQDSKFQTSATSSN